MGDEGSAPHLLHFRLSHYNEKVRWALDFKGWEHTREALVPGFHIPRVRLLSGQNKVPVLVIDDRVLVGSSHIIAEIERMRPSPPLYPEDVGERRRALDIERFFDEEVAPDVRRLFWSTYIDRPDYCARLATDGFSSFVRGVWRACFPVMKPLFRSNIGVRQEQVDVARDRLSGYFDRLESEIQPSGFLVGERFSVADLAAAAVMTALLRPPQFSYAIPEPWSPELVELRASLEHRAGFRWVHDIYARFRGTSSEAASASASS